MLNKKEVKEYIQELRGFSIQFEANKEQTVTTKGNKGNFLAIKLKSFLFICHSFIDLVILKLHLLFPKYRNKKIVYTTPRFTSDINGRLEDRIFKFLFTQNIIYINHSQENRIKSISNQKVYNIGGVVKVIALFSKESNRTMKTFYAYQRVNKWILKGFNFKEVYFVLYYDLNSLSIILSDYRKCLKLIEVQHGSMINYFPYLKRAPLKIIDLFYVKNQPTIDFLKENVCQGYDCEYKLIPYPSPKRSIKPGKYILYASTVELNGIHPVFLEYLKQNESENLTVFIRLHPREKDKENYFKNQLKDIKATVLFDDSKDWLESNTIENVIVVSAWSSMIEDAADNGFKTVILEEFGKERFGYLIDDKNVIFAPDVETINIFFNKAFK